MHFLGIDLGSTTIKVGVLNPQQGTVSAVRTQPFPGPLPGKAAAYFEIDADAVGHAVMALIDEVRPAAADCRGVVVSSQMGGVLLTDAAGAPVTNYLSWRDQRALEPYPGKQHSYFDELRQRTRPDDWDRIGRELKPGSAATLLFWLAKTGAVPANAAMAMSLGDFVVARLCRAPAAAEPTLALGLLDLTAGTWHTDWFGRLGFGSLAWPVLKDFSQPVGTVQMGSARVPCYPAVGDQQAALLGAELAEGELSINISTGSQVASLVSHWQPGDYQTRPFFDGRFINTITHLPAGRSLSALVDLLCELPLAEGYTVRDPWATIVRAVERTADSQLDVNLAFFASAVGDRGHVANLRLEDLTVGSLFRAALRSMADNYAVAAARLSADANWTRLALSGGLPQRFAVLRELLAERFGCPSRMVDTPEETLHGLLRLAQRIAAGGSTAAEGHSPGSHARRQ
ncbi:MAG TPA: FGGY family carbohydrate kinase [Pirellulales bacterium]|nr:FGGY family carbohydrate kinase [Pirellulales bacterium]